MELRPETDQLDTALEATPPSADLWDVFGGQEQDDSETRTQRGKHSRKDVGKRLHRLRKWWLVLSEEKFAENSGRDAAYLRNIESGNRRLVPRTAVDIAAWTGVEAGSLTGVGELVSWTGDRFSEEWYHTWKQIVRPRPSDDVAGREEALASFQKIAKKMFGQVNDRVKRVCKDREHGWKFDAFFSALLSTPTSTRSWKGWPGNRELGSLLDSDLTNSDEEDAGADRKVAMAKEVRRWGAENLKVVRIRSRMTAEQLAKASGVGRPTISQIETERLPFLAHTATMIGAATGADPVSMITGDYPLEWGKDTPYGKDSFDEWRNLITRNKKPRVKSRSAEWLAKLWDSDIKAPWALQYLSAYLNTEPLRNYGRQEETDEKRTDSDDKANLDTRQKSGWQ